jgi:hypothetical protein
MRKLILLGALVSGPAFAAPPSATLVWTAPTAFTDGTPISGTITYNVYQGLTGALTKVQSGISGLTVTITTGLTPGTSQCFAVTAVVASVESAQSAQACAAIPVPTPNSPGQVTVVVTGN